MGVPVPRRFTHSIRWNSEWILNLTWIHFQCSKLTKNSYPKVSAIQTPFTEIIPQSDDAPFSFRFFELLNFGVQSFAGSLFCPGNSESGTFLGGSYFSQVSGMVSWFFWSWASKIWWRLNWIKSFSHLSLSEVEIANFENEI